MSRSSRPPFSPSPSLANDAWKVLETDGQDAEWVPVCACPADFPIEIFDAAVSQLVHHPEYNSTLILRSDIVKETTEEVDQLLGILRLQGLRSLRNIHRRLLPRRPGRDPPIEQDCTFYAASRRHSPEHTEREGGPHTSCLVLTAKLKENEQMPYYHPAVYHLAFRYLTPPQDESQNLNDGKSSYEGARLRIEVVPHSSAPDPKDVNSRLYRTCLSLLETVHRYGWGIMSNYQKRVHHDCLVSREEYQDLYLVMRERHKHLVDNWHESTDPLKHVFEDIGIATFLILLWKQENSVNLHSFVPVSASIDEENQRESMPWQNWSRPPGGFLDFGCGNGLLVHILISEGYIGEGIDVRARISWAHYPPETQEHLHVHALDPLDVLQAQNHHFLKPGTFIIANHADELSPWTPVLAALCGASGYLSIPCCPWSFDARFVRAQVLSTSPWTAFALALPSGTSYDEFVATLRLGGAEGGKSAYSLYRVWLANLSLHCGWEVECETLRIPSTRNWAIIGE
ncbi:hypothetical protein EW145_g5356 [Phellinidium pouzarii]|uniref:tRNA (uracil-O(2)-)-methyltransferase n=1 Tax=Phellinidium pouzarii TaxID=167371 RepID=A0A4V3XC65_9AGAM|nr:hypothetical protein EW145_g5356 [Phellinidium pouzarii]